MVLGCQNGAENDVFLENSEKADFVDFSTTLQRKHDFGGLEAHKTSKIAETYVLKINIVVKAYFLL